MTRPTDPNPGKVLHALKRDDDDTSCFLAVSRSVIQTHAKLEAGASPEELGIDTASALMGEALLEMATQYAAQMGVEIHQVAISTDAVAAFMREHAFMRGHMEHPPMSDEVH